MSLTTPPTPTTPSTQIHAKNTTPSFNSPDADLIIRSCSGGGDFRVHRVILCLASQTFKDMFDVQPQPVVPDAGVDVSSSDDFKDGLPVVRVTETSQTLSILLKLLYPGDPPKISGRATTIAVVKAMDKYMVEDYPKTITAALLSLAEEAPHAVLAFAFRHSLAHEVRAAAAFSTLRSTAAMLPTDLPDDELELLTTTQYREILLYHHTCTLAALQALATTVWTTKSWAQVSVGKERQGKSLYWVEHPVGCTCTRTRRIIEEKARGPDADTAAASSKPHSREKITRTVHMASWAAHLISGMQIHIWMGPHWDNVAASSTNFSANRAQKCRICGPRAEEELSNIVSFLAAEVKRAISEIKLPV